MNFMLVAPMHNINEKWKKLHAQRKSKMDERATTKQKKETLPVTTSNLLTPMQLIPMQRTHVENMQRIHAHAKNMKGKIKAKTKRKAPPTKPSSCRPTNLQTVEVT